VQVKLWYDIPWECVPWRCVHDEAIYKSTFTFYLYLTMFVYCYTFYVYVMIPCTLVSVYSCTTLNISHNNMTFFFASPWRLFNDGLFCLRYLATVFFLIFSCSFRAIIGRTSLSQRGSFFRTTQYILSWRQKYFSRYEIKVPREYTESRVTQTHWSTDLVVGQFPVANARELRHKTKRGCVSSECCATICMRDRRISHACTSRSTCSGWRSRQACHVCRLRPVRS